MSAAPGDLPRRVFEVRTGGARWRKAVEGPNLRPEPEERRREVLLDSFDRRLQDAGFELALGPLPVGVACRLARSSEAQSSATDRRPSLFELAREPVFVWDLPPGPAQRLAEVLEARALRPLGEHELTRARWSVLDDQRKAVARLAEERHEVRPSGAKPRAPFRVRLLVLEGVRGYDAEFARLATLLEAVPGLAPLVEARFEPCAHLGPPPRVVGRWPALPPDVGALEGLARIARAQLAVLRANGAGLLANEDAEYLHDARVAMRRLRSLIAQLDGVLAAEEQAHLAGELRWLASCTGTARDLDTLLFELRLSEPELRAELEPVVMAFSAERNRIQTQLRSDYRSARARALRARLRAVFAGPGDPACAGPKAGKPFAALLARRLRKRFGQVAERAARLGADSPAAELHELRIACKKLRYLLECCRSFVPKPALAGAFQHLKGLQTVLGTVQDAAVQAQLARTLALALPGTSGAGAHLALGQFLERLAQRGRAARARQAELTAEFLAPGSRAELEAVLQALARVAEPR
jgi:CHAD domain-containing protein